MAQESTKATHSVWGAVADPDGRPVGTAEIFWIDPAHAGQQWVGLFDVHKVAHADNDGRFWAPSLPSGDGLLVADFQRLGVSGDRVDIAHAAKVTLPLDGELALVFPHRRTAFGRIAGVITDEVDGRPASRIPIALFVDGESVPLRQAVTTSSGAFEIPWLRAGKYRLVVHGTARQLEGAAPFELKENGRVDATIKLRRRLPGPRTTVRVRVLGALSLPLKGAHVNLAVPSVHVAPKRTDSDGQVEFTDLPARPVQILAAAAGHWPSGTMVEDGATEIAAEIALDPSAQLRVKVIDDSTGQTLRHANIVVSHKGGDQWVWGGVLPPADAPPRDHFDVEVARGPTTVRAGSPGFDDAELVLNVAENASVTLRLQRRTA